MSDPAIHDTNDALPALPRSASLLADGADTIAAIATATGRGALALLRVSGPQARRVATALGIGELSPRVATRVTLRHPGDGTPIDDAMATWFVSPRSYTGEDLLELSTHGGRVVPASVLAACIAAGARLALPGEFTRRAVVNGRMDLVQAEAVADLIDARSVAMQAQALAQLDGGLSRRFAALRDDVLLLEALIAYDIDFPGEDDGPIAPERVTDSAMALLASLDALLATAPRAALLRDGALVVIAGPPNAGKSSLFNALLGESRALVTPIAGTTRDAIEAVLDRRPTPLRFVDTAGLRETTDEIERMGIEVSTRYLANAQVVLACGATAGDVQRTVEVIAAHTSAQLISVHTKIDVQPDAETPDVQTENPAHAPVPVSAETGVGLAALLARIDDALGAQHPAETQRAGVQRAGVQHAVHDAARTQGVLLTRERQRAGVAEARAEIAAFLDAWRSGALPSAVAAVHLQSARDALGSVIGAVGNEDVLDVLFREFCIGK